MKSVKKRFKTGLDDVEEAAKSLQALSSDISLLDLVSVLSESVLLLCEGLRGCVSHLNKEEFVRQIRDEKLLIELDGVADRDLISDLEVRFAGLISVESDDRLGEFMRQMLEKLERHHGVMIMRIRQLGRILDVD